MKKNIVLCGFMGCGKSTVGRRLAKMTGREFIDLDKEIAEREKMSISDIFAEKGEEYFRTVETEVCREVGQQNCRVIATGGGAVMRTENVEALRENGLIVYLKVTYETALERLRFNKTRPLLQRADKEEYISKLMKERDPVYESASDFWVDADKAPDYVVLDIMKTVKIL